MLFLNRKSILLLLAASCLLLFTGRASAQVLITNWSIDGNTLEFDITGTIQVGADIGGSSSHVIFIGAPGNNAWVTSNSTSGTVTVNSGITLEPSQASYQTFNNGDYIRLSKDLANLAVGDHVDAHVSITGGSLNPAGITLADIIVTAGFDGNNPFPDATNQIGQYSAVPEPASWATLLGVGIFAATLARRRRR